MPFSTSPTFVLVPGHWHTASHLSPLVEALSDLGCRARPVQLHSVGAKSTRPTFSDDVCVVYSAVVQELIRGNDVCLVVHSYAGMPGAEAINKLISDGALEPLEGRGRLIRAVFIAAYTFPAHFVMDVRAMLGPDNPAFDIDNDNILHITSPWHNLFNDLRLSDAKPYVDTLAPTYYLGPSFTFAETPTPSSTTAFSPSRRPFARSHSNHRTATPPTAVATTVSRASSHASASKTPRSVATAMAGTSGGTPRSSSPAPSALSRPSTPTTARQKNDAAGPVISSDKWRKANVMAILCRKDNLIPAERQEKIWKGMEREWIEAGHACFVSQPAQLAQILVRSVGKEEARDSVVGDDVGEGVAFSELGDGLAWDGGTGWASRDLLR